MLGAVLVMLVFLSGSLAATPPALPGVAVSPADCCSVRSQISVAQPEREPTALLSPS